MGSVTLRRLVPTLAFLLGSALACSSGPDGNGNDGTGQTGPCGNGQLDEGELCDPGIASGPGACPIACSEGDGVACTREVVSGSADTCDLTCSVEVVGACVAGDNCCPPGCSAMTDSDCSPTCGDGVVDELETCDSAIGAGEEGACPAACDDGNACTRNTRLGAAVNCSLVCAFRPIVACEDGDGCCPEGCTTTTDDDCSPSCGDGVVDPMETCDGNCPESCDDGDACTLDRFTGSADACSLACVNQPLSECRDGDGCCPTGCTFAVDDDCENLCGNGTLDRGETCDGDCPSSCEGFPAPDCTSEVRLSGSPDRCNVRCRPIEITMCADDDGCCPPGCDNTEDNDCALGVGSPCMNNASCPAPLTCFEEIARDDLPGGYCSLACGTESCPEGSECVFLEDSPVGNCLLGCTGDEDCREGYECQSIFESADVCYPPRGPTGGTGGG